MPTRPPSLLAGPYTSPPLRRGDRTTCLDRDADVVITSWTSAPIPWPRCCRPGTHGGGSGLLVTEELVRAIRTESAVALMYWFGVSTHTVWCWRRAFGVGRWGTEGSKLLHQEVSERGADAIRGTHQPEETVRRRMQTRRARGCPPPNRWAEEGWKPDEVALLGTMPDDELARRLGCSISAVSQKRRREGIPNAKKPPHVWTAAEDEAVRTLAPVEAATRTGRTLTAVYTRRFVLSKQDRPRRG
jgi:hypothetical protein